jgi:chaperone BCS1
MVLQELCSRNCAPGTGKTSCIKAIAKYTKRHPVIIPTGNVRDIECLKEIFRNEYIAGYKIPNKERLYIFEEIDCGSWKDIVTSRKIKNDEEKSFYSMIMDKTKIGGEENKNSATIIYPKKEEKILELLDGLVEITGRMFIMTSNHPERLDPALLRPGRVDEIVEFKNMSRTDISKTYKLWFEKDIPDKIMEIIKDHVLSQAEIGRIFSLQDHNLIHRQLIEKCT